MDWLPPFLMPLFIGAVALPALGAILLWALQKVGLPQEFDLYAKFGIAAVLAILVVVMSFFPETEPVIVGVVAFVYQVLVALKSVVEKVAGKVADMVVASMNFKIKP